MTERRRWRVIYELGRVAWALPRALLVAVVVFALASLLATQIPPLAAAAAVLLLVVVCGVVSRGALLGACLGVGAACAAACLVALVAGARGCSSLEAKAACTIVGGAAGALVGALAARSRRRADVVIGAFAGCALHVLVGCATAGLAEAAGLVLGLALGAAPLIALRAR